MHLIVMLEVLCCCNGVTPSEALQLSQCTVVCSALVLQLTLFRLPDFHVPFISIEEKKDGLDCRAKASVLPPVSPPCGFMCSEGGCVGGRRMEEYVYSCSA